MEQLQGLNNESREKLKELIDSLPETDADIACYCGECDGYGHVIRLEKNGYRSAGRCPNKYKSDKVRFLTAQYGTWEGWDIISRFDLTTYMNRKDFVETASFNAITNYLYDIDAGKPPYALLLAGGHGRSKSLAPLFLLKELALRGFSAHAVKWFELYEAHQRGIDGAHAIEVQRKKVESSHYVFVDEYGRVDEEKHGDNALRKILELTHRKKWLVISTNMHKDDFMNTIDSYAQDRLKKGFCLHIEDSADLSLRMF